MCITHRFVRITRYAYVVERLCYHTFRELRFKAVYDIRVARTSATNKNFVNFLASREAVCEKSAILLKNVLSCYTGNSNDCIYF